ncbi:sigma-70 family RNA polymerase sigma factor [Geomicrobium sediminis]|uniref:RNA polymerase sigma factor (Sigma-70 family) n=1 Tax=Geomicrobium sediminis TaxID=1347788 RepID=A0ABS2P6Z7_9BACL|nr:sigma-70 family RNA polymerase sigma factor [Geomicrobium sediminis]MBM7631121.1 RNA polymerase sigma factor (sigma-70 family) [Geomicrobium sediminis]
MRKDIGDGLQTVDEAFEQHGKLVYFCAHKFQRSLLDTGLDFEDLVQAGCEGFTLAFQRFDESKGFKFSTYSISIIKSHMMRLLRDYSTVYFSRPMKDNGKKLLKNGFDEHSKVDDIVNFLNCSKREARYALQYITHRQTASFDRIIDPHSGLTLYDVVDQGANDSNYVVSDFVSRLSQREQDVVRLTLADVKQIEIGNTIGCAQAHVSRLRKQACDKWERYAAGEAI